MALERAAGKPYEALLREHVFDPLKMAHSAVALGDAHRGLLATPYRDDDPTVKTEPWDLGVLSPAGGFALSRLGLALAHLRKYEQAADSYGRALRLKFRPPQTMYNLACVYSLKGDRDEAVRWLERAVSSGFENWETLRTDPDLNNLREDPRFIRLLRRR